MKKVLIATGVGFIIGYIFNEVIKNLTTPKDTKVLYVDDEDYDSDNPKPNSIDIEIIEKSDEYINIE